MNLKQALWKLHELADPKNPAFKKSKFNSIATNALGVYLKDLTSRAREIGRDKELALELFDTGLYDAQILCSKILKPKVVTPDLMERWIPAFSTWEICDSFCRGLFSKTRYAQTKIVEWTLVSENLQNKLLLQATQWRIKMQKIEYLNPFSH
jgi:3-methyladenine DNA glycosylase AlkD